MSPLSCAFLAIASTGTPPSPAWSLEVGALATAPVALGIGFAQGLQATTTWSPWSHGLGVSAVVSGSQANGTGSTWRVSHTHLSAGLGASVRRGVDGAALGLTLSAGLAWIYQRASHLDSTRVRALYDDAAIRSDWTLGPHAALRGDIGVEVIEGWQIVAGAGASVSYVRADSDLALRPRWLGSVGLRHAW